MAFLTKSKFLAGMQCKKRLWLQIHRKDLIPPISDTDKYRLETGNLVGQLACQTYPEGVRADSAAGDMVLAAERSQALVEDESIPVLFEPTFILDNLAMRADIMIRNEDDRWDLHEVKSSTGEKEEHLYDVWFQHHLLKNKGIPVDQYGLTYLNGDYIFDGVDHDLDQLFVFKDFSDKLPGLDEDLIPALNMFKQVLSQEEAPEIEMSKHCKDCEFFDHCSVNKPKYWIYYLPRINEAKWEKLTEMGIEDIGDIPEDFPLSPTQQVVRDATANGTVFNSPGLGEALGEMQYPLYFLDFESFNEAIPRYAGCKPYQQMVFQWSCHIINDDGTMEHQEFLHKSDSDPRKAFIESMLACVGTKGSIVHYAPFEKARLNELAQASPEYADQIAAVVERLYDLCGVISKHYYDPEFKGSFSIKKVLPVLVPELSYEGMEIGEGGTASVKYLEMVNPQTAPETKKKIGTALLAYCKLDTLAMVRIWEELKKKV